MYHLSLLYVSLEDMRLTSGDIYYDPDSCCWCWDVFFCFFFVFLCLGSGFWMGWVFFFLGL